jgi:hypothetical protein
VDFTRITRKYVHLPLQSTLHDGTQATVPGVDVALLPPRSAPSDATMWTPAVLADGSYRVLLAGPDADPTDALVVADDADLWARVTDAPEVDVARLGRITVT